MADVDFGDLFHNFPMDERLLIADEVQLLTPADGW
jgi:hypothetical protein